METRTESASYLNPTRRSRAVAGLAAALVLTLAGCDSDEDRAAAPSKPPKASQQPNQSSAPVIIPAKNCRYSEKNPLSPVKGNIGQVFGLCDLNPTAPAAFYKQPEQIKGTDVGTVKNGEEVTIDCLTTGEPIQDGAGVGAPNGSKADIHDSTIWAGIIKSDGSKGYLPEPWLGFVKTGRYDECEDSNV